MYIGISGYFHESSIALIDNEGKLIDFKKEEWLSRVKGDKSFPRLALKEMIDNHSLSDENIDSVCFYEKPLKAWLTILKHSIKNNSLKNELTRNYFKNIWKSSTVFAYDLSKYLNLKSKKNIVLQSSFKPHSFWTLLQKYDACCFGSCGWFWR